MATGRRCPCRDHRWALRIDDQTMPDPIALAKLAKKRPCHRRQRNCLGRLIPLFWMVLLCHATAPILLEDSIQWCVIGAQGRVDDCQQQWR